MTYEEIKKESKEIEERLSSDEELSEEEIKKLEERVDQLEIEKKSLIEKSEKRKETLEKIKNGVSGNVVEEYEERKEDKMNNAEYRTAYFKKLLGRELTESEERAYAQSGAGAVIPIETN